MLMFYICKFKIITMKYIIFVYGSIQTFIQDVLIFQNIMDLLPMLSPIAHKLCGSFI